MSYMGFPGTMGSADMVDYVLADGVVIPTELRHFYAEKVGGDFMLLLILLIAVAFPVDLSIGVAVVGALRTSEGERRAIPAGLDA